MRATAIALALLALASCTDDPPAVPIGGSAVTVGQVPAGEDGFTITIEKLLFVVSHVEIAGTVQSEPRVFNAKKIEPAELVRAPKGGYDTLAFEVAPSKEAHAADADEADVAFMNERGFAVYFEGVAHRRFIHAFRWGFDEAIRFDCERGPLTVHGERLFGGGYQRFVDADENDDKYTRREELLAAGLRDELVARLPSLVAPCTGQRKAR